MPANKSYRPFGSGQVLTNDNLTDEIAASIIEKNPASKKMFIDAQAGPAEVEEDLTGEAVELVKLTKKQLEAKYLELTQKSAPNGLNHEKLVALVAAELEAKNAI